MKSFAITGNDLAFLLDQVNVPILRVVAYGADGQPIYGYTDPNSLQVVQLGALGQFDPMQSSWANFLPRVLSPDGNTPAGPAEPYGLRNVRGLFNNISLASSASWGAANFAFARNGFAAYNSYLPQVTSNPNHWSRSKTLYAGGPADAIAQAQVDALAPRAWAELSASERGLVADSNWHVEISGEQASNSHRYANPFLSVYDYTPRIISQTVDSSFVNPTTNGGTPLSQLSALARVNALSGGTTYTDQEVYQITDINTSAKAIGGYNQDGSVNLDGTGAYFKEYFIRNLPVLSGDPSISGWQVLFGQFFDHGLDLIHKGGQGATIYIPLDPSDPLWEPNQGRLAISLATVINAAAAGRDGEFGTDDDILSAGADGIWNSSDDLKAFIDPGADGVIGSSDDIHLTASPAYLNHTSPYIDQSQTYGSDDNVTNLLREWVKDANTGAWVAGMRLFNGTSLQNSWNRQNPDGTTIQTKETLPTLAELRRYLIATGRDDLSWGDIGNLRRRDANGHLLTGPGAGNSGAALIADMLNRFDAAHLLLDPLAGVAGHSDLLGDCKGVTRGSDTDQGAKYISDYIYTDKSSGNLYGSPTELGLANRAIVDEILLRSIGDHYIAGDPRANENFGLTAVHHVWHDNHNWQIDNLINSLQQLNLTDPSHATIKQWQVAVEAKSTDVVSAAVLVVNNHYESSNGEYVDAQGRVSWQQEKMFQAGLLINQMEYQHVAIDQYARALTPDIPLFVMYDTSVNADVTIEYSQAAFRFGHSQLRETIDSLDPSGSLTAMVTHFALEQAFLNPAGFSKEGPTAIALGMTRQFSNEIDEFITPALQQKLLGQSQDLAALNIARGRDLGLPCLNELRRQLSGSMGENLAILQGKLSTNPADILLQEAIDKTIILNAGLHPYTSWNDFQNTGLQHPESLINFIAAYSFDGNINIAEFIVRVGQNGSSSINHPADDATIEALGWRSYSDAEIQVQATSFLESDPGFERIDAWNGGLAEKPSNLGAQLGSTFNTIFCDQMTRLINGDRFYYFWRLQLGLPIFTELSSAISTEQFKDVIERTTGARHLVGDVFLAADSYVELGEVSKQILDGLASSASITGPEREHKYGDLISNSALGVWSGAGASQVLNGQITTVNGLQYIRDMRPDLGDNPDGTASKGYNSHEVIGGTINNDFIDAGDGDDTTYGDKGNDILMGMAGADHLYGEEGDDLLYGGDLPDFLDGGVDNDTIRGGADADVLIGGDGNDKLFGEAFTDELHGGTGDDYLDGGLDADFIYAGDGQDIVVGGEGLDTTFGEWGDDRMFAGAGPDQLFGGYGDDILNAGTGGGNQTLNVDEALGEYGYNIVSFSDVTISLGRIADLNFQNINLGNSTPFGQLWVDIQGIEGSGLSDQIIGDAGNNWLIGGGSNDYICGGAGDDVIVGDMARLDLLNTLLVPTDQHFLDLQASLPNFSFGMNTSVTADKVVYISPGAGTADTVVYAGDINNFRFQAVFDPGDATKTIGVRIFDLTGNETATNGDLVLGMERAIFGSDFAATNLNASSHLLLNAATAASLNTNQNINLDSLVTASGFAARNATTMAATSTLEVSGYDNVLTVTAANISSVYGVASIESVIWQQQAPGNVNNPWTNAINAYSSTYQASLPFGFTSESAISAGTIFRPIVTFLDLNGIQRTATGLPSNAMGQLVLGDSTNNSLTGTSFQDVIYGGAGNDSLSGIDGNDELQGGTGNDSLNGGGGNDTMIGGAGDDTYYLAGLDILIEGLNEGNDTVISAETYILPSNIENLKLTGSTNINGTGNNLNNLLSGNSGNNSLTGGAGNDSIDGGPGNDSLSGGAGDDIYIVDSSTDLITEAAGAGTDTVKAKVSFSLAAIANVENITLTGSANIDGTANSLNNLLIGNSGNNSLSGGEGNDTIIGGAGNDSLDGGAGADSLTGGIGADTFRLAAFINSLVTSIDVITDFAIGTDLLDGPTAVAAANISKLSTGNAFSADNLAHALSSTNFIANGGSLLTFTNGTYLALNNNIAGWDAASDAVIRFGITGNAANLSII